MARLTNMNDTMFDVIKKMTGNNPGAMSTLINLCEAVDSKHMGGVLYILQLDSLEIYDEKIYMLYNDCCQRDINKMIRVLDKVKMEEISEESLLESIGTIRGKNIEA